MSQVNDDKKYADLIKIQQGLAIMVKKHEKKIAELQLDLDEKKKEIVQSNEAKKSMEIKSDEMFKNCTKVNMSDLTEIKSQYENDKRVLNEMIKTLQNTIASKNTIMDQLTSELNSTREQCELERKKNIQYFSIKSSNNSNKSFEVQFHKISSENTSLKASLITSEEAIEKLQAQNKILIEEKEQISLDLSQSLQASESKFERLKSAYETVIKDFTTTSEILAKSKNDLNEITKANTFLEYDVSILQKKNAEIEKENIELKSENDSVKQRMQTYSYETDSLKKEIASLEKSIADNKLSKQIFFVTYVYMAMTLSGSFIFEREGNVYVFIVENRASSRKFSLMDVDITANANDKTKVVLTFANGSPCEEYGTNETAKLLEAFMNFKQRVVSVGDISSEAKSKRSMNDQKVLRTEKQIKGLLDFI